MADIRRGRPPIENPKSKKMTVRLTQDEFDLIDECSKGLCVTKTDVILQGVRLVRESLKKEK